MSKINKIVFLERLMRERDKFEWLLNRVGFSRRMTMKGVCGAWSIKDILAHILSYEQYTVDRMEQVQHGIAYVPCQTYDELNEFIQEFGYPDFGSSLTTENERNAWVVEKYKNIPLDEIVAQEIHAFTSIVSMLEKMTEVQLNQFGLFEQIAENTYRHYREHITDIWHWLRATMPRARSS